MSYKICKMTASMVFRHDASKSKVIPEVKSYYDYYRKDKIIGEFRIDRTQKTTTIIGYCMAGDEAELELRKKILSEIAQEYEKHAINSQERAHNLMQRKILVEKQLSELYLI